MDNEKEKWIDEVFESLHGIQRAEPPIDLYNKIEAEVISGDAKVIPLYQFRRIAIAAILLLGLNGYVILQSSWQNNRTSNEVIVNHSSEQELISNFKLYD